MKGYEERKFTFTGGKRNSTINYAIGGEEIRERIESLKIGDRIKSDHHPVEIKIKGGNTRKERAEEQGRNGGGTGKKVESCSGKRWGVGGN